MVTNINRDSPLEDKYEWLQKRYSEAVEENQAMRHKLIEVADDGVSIRDLIQWLRGEPLYVEERELKLCIADSVLGILHP
jgi:predicted nuclease with TOPRIM domain